MTTLRNSVQLIGRLGNDPEATTFGDNKTKVRFSIATSEHFKDKTGERKENTQWHNIIAWNGTAKVAEKYLKKGQEVAISGRITYRSWDDKDGNTRYITEIVANEIIMFSKNN